MDRAEWLKDKRRAAEARMDQEWAPIYDESWGSFISDTHRKFMRIFLDGLPDGSLVLDAACGTGKYWPLILAAGYTLVGIDQSQGMLSRAHAKFPAVQVEKLGLQEIHFAEAFDAIACIDALESVPPEDWPPVLMNFRRALKPGGCLYLTVELAAEKEIDEAFQAAQAQGLPVVHGEWAPEGRYHFYPPIPQVKAWLEEARFSLSAEGQGDDYYHCIVRKTR